MADQAHYVKVRKLGAKRWTFLARNGTNSLRVHAIRFASKERAQTLIDENAPENPDWEWKTVPVNAGESNA